jgi:hypothetical protein
MGRQTSESKKPFRFILNHSSATAPNVYLMLYPKPVLAKMIRDNHNLLEAVWQALDDISPERLIGEGRVYGGGLYKIEPNELANAAADNILAVLPETSTGYVKQLDFFASSDALYGKFGGADLLADLEAEHRQELRREEINPDRDYQINPFVRSNNDTP